MTVKRCDWAISRCNIERGSTLCWHVQYWPILAPGVSGGHACRLQVTDGQWILLLRGQSTVKPIKREASHGATLPATQACATRPITVVT